MTYNDVVKSMREFIGTREILRRLGFLPDEIFLAISPSLRRGGLLSAFAVLKTQGMEFSIECGPVDDKAQFAATYLTVCEMINAGSMAECDLERMWKETEAYRRFADFILALRSKGFKLPSIDRGIDFEPRVTPKPSN